MGEVASEAVDGERLQGRKVNPPVGFHQLRHTWAAHAVINGVPLAVVAGNLGHSGMAMVDKRYGHLAPNQGAEAIRAHAPKFGFKPERAPVRRRPSVIDAPMG